jgi:hypothetical protein
MKTSLVSSNPDGWAEWEDKIQSFGPQVSEAAGTTAALTSGRQSGGQSSDAIAAMSRVAGRLNAARIPQREIDDWQRERTLLLDKKLGGSLTAREARRLQYVRWTLDRIDDARYGISLDRLEEAVRLQEEMAARIDALTTELHQFIGNRNERRK